MSLNVAERTREFGLLQAVGTTQPQLRSIVRWEAATVVMIGTVLGVITAVATALLVRIVAGTALVSPVPQLAVLGEIVAGAVVVTFLSSALPARRAASAPILEAIREL
jgi:putative ABC transport system permease protein